MKKSDINATDVVAMLLITGCFVLKGLGINTVVDSSIALIAGFYFGQRIKGGR